MVIGLRGQMGSGKGTLALILQDYLQKGITQYPTYTIKNYGDKLKDIAAILTGKDRKLFESQEFKASKMDEKWGAWVLEWEAYDHQTYRWIRTTEEEIIRLYSAMSSEVYKHQKYFYIPTYREFLQRLATEGIRDIIHPDAFIIALFSEYDTWRSWIIADMRVGLPNESKAVKDRKGIIVDIIRPDSPIQVNGHITEVEDKSYPADITIVNDGSIEDLEKKVRKIKWEEYYV